MTPTSIRNTMPTALAHWLHIVCQVTLPLLASTKTQLQQLLINNRTTVKQLSSALARDPVGLLLITRSANQSTQAQTKHAPPQQIIAPVS